ncbi:hypothetical protein [Tindallia californiensis]|uniref:Uncharacterized protein n=1 Tax=Tindallia californiensis TaxID=159292 RepID=A0A1H3P681_9FIRM|nr:hypothetical protein [Tindallia californiensis]SDY96622.1 hypothetical protein SAMN05192546_10633 [Tindallia californiensis]
MKALVKKQVSGKRIVCLLLVGMILMMVVAPSAYAQLTFDQGEEIIHELEEIAHELEHVEEWLQLMMIASFGILVVLAGQLVVQYMEYKKK